MADMTGEKPQRPVLPALAKGECMQQTSNDGWNGGAREQANLLCFSMSFGTSASFNYEALRDEPE